jgi:hypothetical protein
MKEYGFVGRLGQLAKVFGVHRIEPAGAERHGWADRMIERAGASESNTLQFQP